MIRYFFLHYFIAALFLCSLNSYAADRQGKIEIKSNNHKLHVISLKKIANELIEVSFKQDDSCGFYTNDVHNIDSSPSIVAVSDNISQISTIWPKCKVVTNTFGETEMTNAICYGDVTFRTEFRKINENDGTMRFEYLSCCKDMCYPGSVNIRAMHDGSVYVDDDLEIDMQKKDSQESVRVYDVLYIIGLSFLGGFVMNLMPCVLPILGIKILSITKHSGESKLIIRLALLSTLFGIIVSFLIFAATTLGLMVLFDSDLGVWGSIFQNRYFVLAMCFVIFFIIELQFGNLSHKVTNISAKCYEYLTRRGNICLSSFIYGLFITLIAAPCTAPFVGQAMSAAAGYASNSLVLSMLIFVAMALGFGLPYLIATIYPEIVQMIPKTRKITNVLSRVITVTLFVTLIWMLYILSGSVGKIGILIISTIMIATSFLLRYYQTHKKLVISIFIVLVGFSTYAFDVPYENEMKVSWIKLSPEALDKYIARNDIILVNVTANWCGVCQFNKWTTLSRSEFTRVISDYEIVLMEGDITRKNELVSDFLQSVGSRAIPYTAIFSAINPSGRVLSSILSLDYIKKEIDIESKGMDEYRNTENFDHDAIR